MANGVKNGNTPSFLRLRAGLPPPPAHLQSDRGSLEPEGLADSVLEVAPVGEVEVHGVVDGDGESGRGDADLAAEEDPDRKVTLVRLRGVRLRGAGEEPVELARKVKSSLIFPF